MRLLRWVCRSSTSLVAVNGVALILAFVAGWTWGTGNAGASATGMRHAPPAEAGRFLLDAFFILEGNLRVVATLLLGACTGGLLALVVLVWNGYALGVGSSTLAHTAPEYLPLLARYVGFEFSGLVLASAASMSISFRVLWFLLAREPLRLGAPLVMCGLAAVMLVTGALIEAHVMHTRAPS